MQVRRFALICLLAAGLPALADAPGQSLRPLARGTGSSPATTAPAARTTTETSPTTTASGKAPQTSLRPQARQNKPRESVATNTTAAGTTAAVAPVEEPKGLFRKRKLRKGSVCGDINVQGEKVGRVPGKISGCGIDDAVRVRSVAGVALSTPAVIDCPTALALSEWVDKGLQPAFKRQGKVVELRVAAHYACRTRNNQPGAKISEHGRGRAIDISAFTLKDGRVYTVKESWWRGRGRKPMRKAYDKACGIFGTTLGPDGDRYHQDHFHFDTARYRSGPYCK